jgi:hypothetical protein
LLAWKNRIACTEAVKHEVHEEMELDDLFSGLRHLVQDVVSLNKVQVCPGDSRVYGVRALTETCKGFNVPKRDLACHS